MAEQQIRFDDGAAYERSMGVWSKLVGDVFLDWLALRPNLRWIDVGCGNGAFTQLLVDRCAPAEVQGVDPSEAQLAFARTRPAAKTAEFLSGDAMALPFPADRFDAAVMALVIFFVPEPEKGVAEMTRVVKPGGLVSAYAWDVLGGGLPMEPIFAEFRALGLTPLLPPRPEASQIDALAHLWAGAGIGNVETREIVVERSFADFEDFWTTTVKIANLGARVAELPPEIAERLKAGTRARLPVAADGSITHASRANAVKGHVPR